MINNEKTSFTISYISIQKLGGIMKKLILAGVMALSAIGSANAGHFGDSFGGTALGSFTGTMVGNAVSHRGRDRVVVEDRNAQREIDRLQRENEKLRDQLDRIERKLDKRDRK